MSDDLELMTWHLRSGYVVLGLLAFRLVWGLIGTRHARFAAYRTSGRDLVGYFLQRSDARVPRPTARAHTPPGVVMAWLVWFTCLIQAVTGLFTTDDIFTEGPLARSVSADQVDTASFIHTRVYWAIITLVVAHIGAILWYAARRDALSMSMFTGRKDAAVDAVGDRPAAAACAWLTAIAVIVLLARL